MDFENLIAFIIICGLLAVFGFVFLILDVEVEENQLELESYNNMYLQNSIKLTETYNPKWDHMPITYHYEIIQNNFSDGFYKCFDKKKIKIKQSFNKISSVTNDAVTFKEVEQGGDIVITCGGRNIRNINSRTYEVTLGLAGYSYTDGIITNGTLEFFVDDSSSSIGDKNANLYNKYCLETELHEILHLFDFGHNETPGDIMNSQLGDYCTDDINEYIINDLNRIYRLDIEPEGALRNQRDRVYGL